MKGRKRTRQNKMRKTQFRQRVSEGIKAGASLAHGDGGCSLAGWEGEVMACWCVGDSTVLTAEAGKIGGGQRMNDLICWAKKLEPPFTMNKITVRATSVKLLEENIEESIELHAMDLATISWT